MKNCSWYIVAVEGFVTAANARAASEALGEYLGGLQSRAPSACRGMDRWISQIEVGPEMLSFAHGFLRGWLRDKVMP